VIPVGITRRTRAIGAPRDWDQELDGSCGALMVRDEVELQSGVNFMETLWMPTPDEIEAIKVGLPIHLRISGYIHPVVSVGVATKADVE
jgi:hypothetical protein